MTELYWVWGKVAHTFRQQSNVFTPSICIGREKFAPLLHVSLCVRVGNHDNSNSRSTYSKPGTSRGVCVSTRILHCAMYLDHRLVYSPFLPELPSFPLLSCPESAFRTFQTHPLQALPKGAMCLRDSTVMTDLKAQGVSSHQGHPIKTGLYSMFWLLNIYFTECPRVFLF